MDLTGVLFSLIEVSFLSLKILMELLYHEIMKNSPRDKFGYE